MMLFKFKLMKNDYMYGTRWLEESNLHVKKVISNLKISLHVFQK